MPEKKRAIILFKLIHYQTYGDVTFCLSPNGVHECSAVPHTPKSPLATAQAAHRGDLSAPLPSVRELVSMVRGVGGCVKEDS
jgi:hypothetical protein